MTLSVTIDATGIHAPSYADVLNALKAQYRAIYGPDVYLENDSQDGNGSLCWPSASMTPIAPRFPSTTLSAPRPRRGWACRAWSKSTASAARLQPLQRSMCD